MSIDLSIDDGACGSRLLNERLLFHFSGEQQPVRFFPRRTAARCSIRPCPKRKREIPDLVVNGGMNKAIGHELEVSPSTVEVYRARVMQKLHATNTADLIRIVMNS